MEEAKSEKKGTKRKLDFLKTIDLKQRENRDDASVECDEGNAKTCSENESVSKYDKV